MKYTQEIVGTHGGALLPERAPGECSGSKIPRVYRPLVCYNFSEGFNVLKCLKHWLELMPRLRSEVIPAVTDLLPQFG